MDPQRLQAFPILMLLSKMIDELRKRITEGSIRRQAKASKPPAEHHTVDEESDIDRLKTAKAALMKEVETMRKDWLKAMESFCAVQEFLLNLFCMARPSDPNLSPPQNVRGGFGLPVLLMKMKEELGQRIAEEKAAQIAEEKVADGISDVDALKAENAALGAQLEALDEGWLNMNAAFFPFAKNLVDIGLILAPGEGI